MEREAKKNTNGQHACWCGGGRWGEVSPCAWYAASSAGGAAARFGVVDRAGSENEYTAGGGERKA